MRCMGICHLYVAIPNATTLRATHERDRDQIGLFEPMLSLYNLPALRGKGCNFGGVL